MSDTNPGKQHIFEGFVRKTQTLWYWSQFYLGYKAAQTKERWTTAANRESFWAAEHDKLAGKAWSNISQLRGWWVKVGQFLSTRSDLLPEAYITHLAKLQDMMPHSDPSVMKKIVEKELGKPLNELFSDFEEEALASASIGQVHKARLHSGQVVVVKIQHPAVESQLRQDMLTLQQLAWGFSVVERGVNLLPVLEEWQRSAAYELDFRYEMEFQERARRMVERTGLSCIVPRCYPELCTARVLVMDFIDGFKITDILRLVINRVDVTKLVSEVVRSFAYQIHIEGMYHGDPHPGNILVKISPETKEAKPVLLDWGLVKHLDYEDRIAFSKTVYSIATLDVMGLLGAMEEAGFQFKGGQTLIDPEVYMDLLRVGFFRDSGESNAKEAETAVSALKDSGVNKETAMANNPLEDWPSSIVFFCRVVSMLHGLSLQLGVTVPILLILAEQAERCLLQRYKQPSPLVYTCYPTVLESKLRSSLEWKVHRFLTHLFESRKLLLGAQVAVMLEGNLVVDCSVGRMGPVDTRPVAKDSLFCAYNVTLGLLVTAVLKLCDAGTISLDDPVCNYWDGFIRFGKKSITIRDILTHRGGMHAALPKDLRLTQLIDYEKMISIFEDAYQAAPNGAAGGEYAYLAVGWILAEVVRGATGRTLDSYIRQEFIRKFKLKNEMFYPCPKELPEAATQKFAGRAEVEPAALRELKAKLNPQATVLAEASGDARTAAGEVPSTEAELPRPRTSSQSEGCTSPMFTGDGATWTGDGATYTGSGSPISDLEGASLQRILRQQSVTRSSFLRHLSPTQLPASLNADSAETASSWLRAPGRHRRRSSINRSLSPAYYNRQAATAITETHQSPSNAKLNEAEKFFSRFITGRRELGPARITEDEVNTKMAALQRLGAFGSDGNSFEFTSKYVHKLKVHAEKVASGVVTTERGSAADLLKMKPHVMDPLLYDSRHIQARFIPPTNCRATARAFARFYGFLCEGHILKPETIKAASRFYTLDSTPSGMLFTGGASRLFGLGFQLFPIVPVEKHLPVTRFLSQDHLISQFKKASPSNPPYATPPAECTVLPGQSCAKATIQSKVTFCGTPYSGKSTPEPSSKNKYLRHRVSNHRPSRVQRFRTNEEPNASIVVGIGNSDMGGSVAVCFPALRLSICILVNDILRGPIAAREVLTFILQNLGWGASWDAPICFDEIQAEFERIVVARSKAEDNAAAVLQALNTFSRQEVL